MARKNHFLLKKHLSLFLSGSLILIFAGCNTVPPIHSGTTTPTATEAARTEAPPSAVIPTATSTVITEPISTLDVQSEKLRGVILRFWHPWNGAPGQVIASLVEAFNLQNPWDILVTPVSYPGFDALHSALTEGAVPADEYPQVAVGFQHQALKWEADLKLVDLQPYLMDPEWGLSADEREALYAPIWDHEIVDGRRLGIPVYRSGHLIFYNQTWAKELGFQLPPATPEQFQQQACAAALAVRSDSAPSNYGKGGWIVSSDYPEMLSWIYAFGGDPLKSPEPGIGQSVYQFNTPETGKALSFLREMYDSGCAWQSEGQAFDRPFINRLGIFASGSVLDIPYLEAGFRLQNNQDEWTVIPVPSPSLVPSFHTYGPSSYVFAATPEQQLASWLLIRWLSTPENHARLVESIGALPVREDSMEYLDSYSQRHPQWAEAVELLRYARTEPAYASWGQVRFALGDAGTQLFRSYFSIDQVPAMLEYLDTFAAELHLGLDLESVFSTPTSTRTPTRTPTPPPPTSTATRTRPASPSATQTAPSP